MARPAPARLPSWIVLVLLICLSGLAVHFYIESLGMFDLPVTHVLNECTGHCEDHFIPLVGNLLDVEDLVLSLMPYRLLLQASFDHPPLLPPPNS